MPTSNQKGKLAEFKALARALELGFAPAVPAIDCRYDMVLDDGKKLWRVQVKSADGKSSCANGSVIVKLAYEKRQRRNVYTYSSDEVDVLVVYLPRIDKLCWIPIEVFQGKYSLSLRIEAPLNGQKDRVNLASDYYW